MNDASIPQPEPPQNPLPQRFTMSPRARRFTLAAPLVLVLTAVAFDLSRQMTGTAPQTRPSAVIGCSSASQSPTPSPTASMDAGWMGLSTFIGRQAGTRLAGNAPQYINADQVDALGDERPAGAAIDPCAGLITFTGSSVSFVVEAVPPNNPDMTFRIAGLINPTVEVRRGATVTVEFINADTDQAHGWVVSAGQTTFAFRPDSAPAIPGAEAAVIGDPVNGRQGARTITFTATDTGRFTYLCPMPGHAEMGMHGEFVVTP